METHTVVSTFLDQRHSKPVGALTFERWLRMVDRKESYETVGFQVWRTQGLAFKAWRTLVHEFLLSIPWPPAHP